MATLARMTMVFQHPAVTDLQTCGFDLEGNPGLDAADLQDLVDRVANEWAAGTVLRANHPAAVKLLRAEGYLYDIVESPVGSGIFKRQRVGDIATKDVVTASQPGTKAGDPLPPELRLVLTFRTGASGRNRRGRMYVPGFATTDLTSSSGLIDGTRLQTILNDYLDMFQACEAILPGGATVEHVVTTLTDVADQTREVTQVQGNRDWDVQRRGGADNQAYQTAV